MRDSNGNCLLHNLSTSKGLQESGCHDYGFESFVQVFSKFDDSEQEKALQLVNKHGQTVKATASTKLKHFIEWSETEESYRMVEPAFALVIYSTLDREEADTELSSVTAALSNLGMSVNILKDPNKSEVMSVLSELTQILTATALVVVTMSHGKAGTILTKTGDLEIQAIIDCMASHTGHIIPKVRIFKVIYFLML